jgi:hypothetical protein
MQASLWAPAQCPGSLPAAYRPCPKDDAWASTGPGVNDMKTLAVGSLVRDHAWRAFELRPRIGSQPKKYDDRHCHAEEHGDHRGPPAPRANPAVLVAIPACTSTGSDPQGLTIRHGLAPKLAPAASASLLLTSPTLQSSPTSCAPSLRLNQDRRCIRRFRRFWTIRNIKPPVVTAPMLTLRNGQTTSLHLSCIHMCCRW